MTWMHRLTGLSGKDSKSSMAILTRLPIEAGLDSLTGITNMNRLPVRINFRSWMLDCVGRLFWLEWKSTLDWVVRKFQLGRLD